MSYTKRNIIFTP